MDFVFAPGPKTEQLVRRLADTGGWGQITGPHGSGKSTLLVALIEELKRVGFAPVRFSLHDNQRRMATGWVEQVRQAAIDTGRAIVVVDGYEQLSWLAASRLKRRCHRRHWGLLVTAHRNLGLPTLYRTASTLDLAEALVQQLANGQIEIERHVIRQAFVNHDGNLRDVFFDLYDHYERHCRHDN